MPKGRDPSSDYPLSHDPDGGRGATFCRGGARKDGGVSEGAKSMRRLDRAYRARGGKWIQGMHMKRGALHEQLHVPQGTKIPAAKLEKAANSDNPTLAKRARLAETLKGFKKD
jgi:hypothetical protein